MISNRLMTLKKASAALVLGAVLLTGTYVPRAHAQLATFDVANFITNTAQTTILQTLNGVAWAVAKTAIQSMTRSVVNWINSGYQGEPAFSQNLKRDLRQVGDGAANLFLYNLRNNIKDDKVVSPFIQEAAQMTVNAYLLATSDDALAQRLKYTLLDYTRDSVAYMRGDLPPRGLADWHSMVFQCGNDPFCVSYATQDQLLAEISSETRSFLQDLTNGRGFLSWKGKCKAYALSTSFNQDPATPLSDEDTCLEYDVLTPGAVVEETLGITVNSPLRQLELADSVNEIVGAVVTQMVNQVLGGGGLFGLSKPSSGGGTRPIDNVTNSGGTATTISSGFESIITSEREKTAEFKTSWTDIRDLAQTAQDTCEVAGGAVSLFRASKINDTLKRATAAIKKADEALGDLDSIIALLAEAGNEDQPSSSQLASSQRAWDMYQKLLAQGALVTAQEYGDATAARSEISGSNSLYLQMKGYVEDCS